MFLNILKHSKPLIIVQNYAKHSIAEMKYLNVAEKHDAAKTIAGLLSNGTARRREGLSKYNKIFDFEADVKGKKSKMVMTSVSGHLLSLEFLQSYRNWKTVDPKSLFDAPVRKACSQDYEPIKRTLEREIKTCQGLIIWTDCDREGENIGFEIISVCRAIRPNIVVYRAIFSEITSRSVRRALQTLIQPDKRQSDAVDVRTELDLRSGAAITRYQTMRLQRLFPSKIADNLISYGSCQIPTLGFVVERYKEVEAFVSEPFWKIKVIHTIDDLTVEFNWARNRLFDKNVCEDYFLLCLADPKATVEKVTVKPKSKWRPTPMDTVELEKLGSRKLKLSAKETMTIAEKLYTKGLISYPRTETNQFSKEIDLRSLVEQQTSHGIWGSFAQRVIEWTPNPRNGNKSDQAHPPIHPTKMVADLQGNEGRVYELICRHFLACVSKDAIGSETIVNVDIAGEKFHANGLCIYERNYLDVYIYDKWNAKQIHSYEQGQQFDPTEISMPEGATTAPPLLTEADLIVLMEKHGIGTDATHAEHINTIKERGYIGVVDNGFLVPGVIGMGLYEGYDAMNLVLAKPLLRAEFEADLKKVCMGEKDPKQVLSEHIEIYKQAYKQITEKISAMDEKVALRISETPAARDENNSTSDLAIQSNDNVSQELFKCPKCENANLALRQKKNKTGFYIGCMSFPDCKHYIGIPDDFKEPSVKDELCPKCRAKLIKMKFQSIYLKTLFNTPNGWYKTCLICDNKLQTTFNINLESVKRLGPIVNDHNEPLRSQNNTSSHTNDSKNAAELQKKSKSTTTNTNKQNIKTTNSIRTYFTAGNSQGTTTTARNSQTAQEATDSFCNNVDDLDLLLVAASNTNITSANASSDNQGSNNININELGEIVNDIEDIFGDGTDDALFASLEFDTAGQPQSTLSSNNVSQSHRQNYEFENSFNDMLRDGEESNENYVWGTAARRKRLSEVMETTKKLRLENSNNSDSIQNNDEKIVECNRCHEPAKRLTARREGLRGRDYYICSKRNPCKYFQWADEEPIQPNNQSNNLPTSSLEARQQDPVDVKCNCGNTASCNTVRKEGPNKGRSFLACANRNQSCGFFQWGDEPATSSIGERSTNDDDGRDKQNADWGSWGSQKIAINANRTSDTVEVKCNCGGTARSFTVRKEGPNKGRSFMGCANVGNSCGFFQWSDENGSSSNNSDAIWGTSSSRQNNNVNRSSQSKLQQKQNASKGTRKCGICRQEGHTKLKCPRKEEFDT